MTATVSPRVTGAVLMAAPRPAITPQPSSPATSGSAAGFTLVHCPAATSVLPAKAPMPSAGDNPVPSSRVIFWVALWVLKQYQGRPRRQARHSPQTARQFRMTKSPGADGGHPVADRFHHPGGLMTQQVREVVADPALAVVQVGVAHPAGLHVDQRLPGPGIGHDDGGHLDRGTFSWGDDAPHLCCHPPIVPNQVTQRKLRGGLASPRKR